VGVRLQVSQQLEISLSVSNPGNANLRLCDCAEFLSAVRECLFQSGLLSQPSALSRHLKFQRRYPIALRVDAVAGRIVRTWEATNPAHGHGYSVAGSCGSVLLVIAIEVNEGALMAALYSDSEFSKAGKGTAKLHFFSS